MLFHLAPCVGQVRQTSVNIGRGDVVGKDITNERPEMDYNHSPGVLCKKERWNGGEGWQPMGNGVLSCNFRHRLLKAH